MGVFDRVASSYSLPSKDCQELVGALPRGVLSAIIKVQARFRGYYFKVRMFSRARSVSLYCKSVRWPRHEAPRPGDDDDEDPFKQAQAKKKKRPKKKVDRAELEQEIAEYTPTVSKYLGGDSGQSKPAPFS